MSTPFDLQRFVTDVITAQPQYSGLRPTVEKELLHYEILSALSSENLLSDLVFQGGTCLRMIHQSARLSEDLDFVGGTDFDYTKLTAIKECLQDHIGTRYGVRVNVSEPAPDKLTGDGIMVGRWKVSVETQGEDRSAPWQKIKLEVANVPSYTRETRPIRLNYPEVPGGFGTVLINCESLNEILADKYVALTCRRALKARDIWDIAWLRQRNVVVDTDLVARKFQDYRESGSLADRLGVRMAALPAFIKGPVFEQEMRRFLLPKSVEETLDKPGFLDYLAQDVSEGCQSTIDGLSRDNAPSFSL